ncbi:MAG: hypothetical protein JO316_05390 [Abitibacteriaceae bacterium]|nr:hypothetical protein [Abditibacteriaceae bacterium]
MRDERRLEALYAWEQRLRGYDLFPMPVALEPTFVPYDPLADAESGGWAGVPQPRDGALEGEDAYDPRGRAGTPLGFCTLRLPQEQKVAPAQAHEFLAALRALSRPVALEIVADARSVRYQVACAPRDGASVASAFSQCFPLPRPEARTRSDAASGAAQLIADGPDALVEGLSPLAQRPCVQRVVDFGLYHPAYRPLRLFESFAADPHGALLGALGALGPGEVAGVQVLAVPAQGVWAPSLSLLVAQFDGATGAAHPNASDNELQRGLRYKLATPLWSVALRVFAFASARSGSQGGALAERALLDERALGLCRRLGAALDGFASDAGQPEAGNRFVALDDAGYPDQERLRDLLARQSRRTGMLLSQAELAGLWHPPSERLAHPRLLRYDPHEHELPDYLKDAPGAALGVLASQGALASGESGFSGAEPQLVTWPDALRNRHLYMLGATRMGKSTLLLNLIAQDMLAGRGLCLIDPHGDLALDVLRRVPPEREEDALYLDLSDTARPPALGLLEAGGEWEQRLLVSDLLAILHRLFAASWGDRLEHILRHALLTLLAAESSPLGTPLTLRDIRPLLASKKYRRKLLERVPDPDLQTFWHSEFPGYTASAFAPVYNKLGLLLSSPVVRNIVGGSRSKLRAGDLMKERGILLVNLAQSLIGEDNAHFLGALLVSKIQLAAMHGLRYDAGEREPFTLYVDEFQNFVVSSFEKILSEAGKAGLTLVMANQFLEQLGEGLPTAIRSNTGTLVSFRVSAQSGRALEGEAKAQRSTAARPSAKARFSDKERQSPTQASQARRDGSGEDGAGVEENDLKAESEATDDGDWQGADGPPAADEPTIRGRPAPSPRPMPASRSRRPRSGQTRLRGSRRTRPAQTGGSLEDAGTAGQGDTAAPGRAAPKDRAAPEGDAAPAGGPSVLEREGSSPEGYEPAGRPIRADGRPPADAEPDQHHGPAGKDAPAGGDAAAEGVGTETPGAGIVDFGARNPLGAPANASVASESGAGQAQQEPPEQPGYGSWGIEPSEERPAQDVAAAPFSPSAVLPSTTAPTLFFGFPEPLAPAAESPAEPALETGPEASDAITEAGKDGEQPQQERGAGESPAEEGGG